MSTTRVVGGLAAVLLVVRTFWARFRPRVGTSAIIAVVQPILLLVTFGLGVGVLVDANGAAGAVTGTDRYLSYVAPALLATTALQTATSEATYPVLAAFRYDRLYQRLATSPITPWQVAHGHLAWIVLRLVFVCGVLAIFMAVVADSTPAGVVGAWASAVLTGAVCAAWTMSLAAVVRNDSSFNPLFRFVVVPMTLFAGTFFPVSRLPWPVRPLAWISPMWHGTELARGAFLSPLAPAWVVLHLGYLVAALLVGLTVASRVYKRKLHV